MGVASIIRKVAWQRELAHYPSRSARVGYLESKEDSNG